ncbi:thiamine biosynthesis [Micractinium conductrix]|uniref:Thiamine biosynthesis n=1 Tax=Micractinium conductrix TaxID=554055 RepID=A0A2P6V668_9CHLO|nr:thiamine biosynthesis [Micractinium conductrix]|eukprot:PSC69586.1 thiamine biosynthesis [Micractinium conductrix]
MFLLKLAAISVTLGAAIKYGSLLTDLAFTPNAGVATAIVAAPSLIWAAFKLSEQDK